MAEIKDFHISDILTVTTGKLVSSRHMAGIYDVLEWMTGGPVWTHQIPRIGREAKPVLLAAHPQLAEADCEGVTPENINDRIVGWVAQFGETLPVPRMGADQHERVDPISELAEKVHPSRILVVETPDAG